MKRKSTARQQQNIINTRNRSKKLWLVLGVMFAIIIVYSPVFQNNILYGWDDGEYFKIPAVQQPSFQRLAEVFTDFHLGMYQPVAVLSFSINRMITGDASWGFILVNVLLHLINVFLVFKLALHLTKRDIPALFAALIFGIHPMNVEAVAWISTRSSGLFSMFYLLALLQYCRYLADTQVKTKLYSTFALFLLALFSKSMAVSLPFVLVLLDYYYQRILSGSALLEKLPFVGLSVIFGLISVKAAGTFGHIELLETQYTFIDRIMLLSYAVSLYLTKFIVPVNLSVIYTYPEKTEGFLPLIYYLSIAIPITMVFLFVILRRWRRELVFVLFFFVITLAPVLPFWWSRIFIAAERYVYIPYLGLFFLLAIFAGRVYSTADQLFSGGRQWLTTGIVCLIFWFALTTFHRTKVWKDMPTLMEDVIDKQRSNSDLAFAWFFLGNYHERIGNPERALKSYDLAVLRYPGHIQALNNRGILKGTKGDMEGAMADFNQIIQLRPSWAEGWYNRGIVFYHSGKKEEACSDWQQSSALGFEQAALIHKQLCE